MYAAHIEGEPVELEVLSVYRRNMVVQDRRSKSIFQQSTGECIAGKFTGKSLPILAGELVRWGEWKREHPDTLVAREPERWTGVVPKRVIEFMLDRATRRVRVPGEVALDGRLAAEEPVVGVVVNGVSAAWTVALLREKSLLRVTLGGAEITLAYSANGDRVRVWRGHGEAPSSPAELISCVRGYWAGWVEFHPATELFTR